MQRIRCTIVANIINHHLFYSPNAFLSLLIDINDDHRAGWTFWWCNNELIVRLIQDFVDRLAVDFWDVLIRDQCTVRTYILFMKYFLQHQWHAMQHFNRYFSAVVSNVFIETTSHISMTQNHSTIIPTWRRTHTHWHKDLQWASFVGERHLKEPLERLKKPQQIHRAFLISPHQHTLFSRSLDADQTWLTVN